MLTGFVLLIIGFWGWMFLSDAYFLQPFFIMVALGNLGMAIAGIKVFQSLPAYTLPLAVERIGLSAAVA
jgi:hypothetical protein